MNKMKFKIIIVLFIVAVIPACGLVYTNIKTPTPTLAIQTNAEGQDKIGRSSCTSYLWIVGIGDCSVTEAMKNGEIKKVHHVDTEMKSILLGIYEKYTTVVYGE